MLLLGPSQLQSDAAGDQRGPKAPANSRDHTASSLTTLTSFLPLNEREAAAAAVCGSSQSDRFATLEDRQSERNMGEERE